MGETRVDLLHLLEDLRDAYPGSLEETIIVEIVANSLDSGAHDIAFAPDPVERHSTVVDDGAGMQRRALARYHDLASSTKTRGQGIGFAALTGPTNRGSDPTEGAVSPPRRQTPPA